MTSTLNILGERTGSTMNKRDDSEFTPDITGVRSNLRGTLRQSFGFGCEL